MSEKQLKELGEKIFEAVGTPQEEAAWVTDCLVLSNLKGVDSHGVRLIPGYVKAIQDGVLKPGVKIKIVKEMAATTFIDGSDGFGYMVAREAMNSAIKKASQAGVAYSGVKNIHHIGRVGRWPEMALEKDMIGFASQPGGVYIAPWGGIERKLPIAPISMAIPTHKHPPIVVDMSLGPIAGGRLSILSIRKQKLPLGWLIDEQGKPTDDPKLFVEGKGAQLPLGQEGLGYKGMALSLFIDILAGPLLGYFVTQVHPFKRRGVFFGAINVDAFTPVEEFKKGVDELITDIKSSKLAENFEEIMMPGEPEWREHNRRLKEGIFVDDSIYDKILETASNLGIDTSLYEGKPGKTSITHPSYKLTDRYQ